MMLENDFNNSKSPWLVTRLHIPVFLSVCWGAGTLDRIPVPSRIRWNPTATSLMSRLFYGPEPYFCIVTGKRYGLI